MPRGKHLSDDTLAMLEVFVPFTNKEMMLLDAFCLEQTGFHLEGVGEIEHECVKS